MDAQSSLQSNWNALPGRRLDGYPVVGTLEKIVDTLKTLSDIGVDGGSLTWVDYIDGIARLVKDIMPLLEQSGLRKSFTGVDAAA